MLGVLEAAAAWERRSTYRTAWAVCPWTGCQCSYLYGHGPAIGPHTERGCFGHLTSEWRALAPLMSPWCTDGDVPTAANLNLYGGSKSYVSWHCDDEPLFGGVGEPKLIVSLSLGDAVTFKLKAKSCLDSEVRSCRLHHGDLLVMDGRCQDEYLHCTSPGLADRRVNITYRWIRNHAPSCPLAAGVLGSLPTCVQGSPVLGPVTWEVPGLELVILGGTGGIGLWVLRSCFQVWLSAKHTTGVLFPLNCSFAHWVQIASFGKFGFDRSPGIPSTGSGGSSALLGLVVLLTGYHAS